MGIEKEMEDNRDVFTLSTDQGAIMLKGHLEEGKQVR